MIVRSLIPLVLMATAVSPTAQARAEGSPAPARAVEVGLSYRVDLVGVDAGRGARGATRLDDLQLIANVSLDRAVGWRGATAFVDVLNNSGGRPNDIAGTLQGVSNIEVGAPKLQLYQAWIEQRLAGDLLSVLVGRYDINSEFYHNDASGLLIAQAFGIGAELSSTGPNGPSTFPQTDLAVRLRAARGSGYAQVAAVRAPRGTIPDEGRRTMLVMAEAGWQGRTALSIGAWAYARQQPLIVPPGVTVGEGLSASRGAYVLAEQTVAGEAERPGYWRAFFRAGFSDGRTTPFSGGFQLGLTGIGVMPDRPESIVSAGFGTGGLSTRYRRANPPGEPALTTAEDTVELTYSDRLLSFLTIQPDIQYVWNPGGLRDAPGVLVLGIRATVDWKLP